MGTLIQMELPASFFEVAHGKAKRGAKFKLLWTPEQLAYIRNAYRTRGATSIARQFGVSPSALTALFNAPPDQQMLDRINEALRTLGWTMGTLCAKIGCTQNTMTGWVQGRSPWPTSVVNYLLECESAIARIPRPQWRQHRGYMTEEDRKLYLAPGQWAKS